MRMPMQIQPWEEEGEQARGKSHGGLQMWCVAAGVCEARCHIGTE